MLAETAAVIALLMGTCTIVVADDRPSTPEIYAHELAHCNGWTHPDQGHKGKPKKGYQSPKPPTKFVREFPGELIVHYVSTEEALRRCGSYGCFTLERPN